MKNAEYGLNENLIFKEAVAFLKKKKTLSLCFPHPAICTHLR